MSELQPRESKIALLEAFLFHYGEPVALDKIARALGIKKSELDELSKELKTDLDGNPRSGLTLLEHDGALQLVTKPGLADARKHIIEEEWRAELTPATQETLSLVAYLGPVSKMTIDYIRGVNSGFTLRNLLMRGLVTRAHSVTHPHSYDYQVSVDFLRHMGLKRAADLPDYEKYRNTLNDFTVVEENEPQPPVEISAEAAERHD